MKDKALLLTINSTYELTGGGIYARTILNGILENFTEVYTIEKDDLSEISDADNIIRTKLNKTLISDFISRLFLCPSFYLYYFFKILLLIKKRGINHVFVHNSRLGLIVFLLKVFTKDVKLYGLSDNQEAKLSLYQFKKSSSYSKKIVRLVDYFLICFSENLFFKFTNTCSFITKEDSIHSDAKTKFILPVCLPKREARIKIKKDIDYLFTGSFFFEPNIDALIKLNYLAGLHPDAKFAVAGRGLSNIAKKMNFAYNIDFYDSPSNAEMITIFLRARAYISLVEEGSGMKTKLAEALSFGLYVFSSRHSAIGYDEIIDTDTNVIYIYSNMVSDFNKWSQSLDNCIEDVPSSVFNEFLTYERSANIIDKMVSYG